MVVRAFSLVELLVCIAILAMLMGILLPSLRSAREQARAAVCASNVRQIALANELYAEDNEYSYCPGAARFKLGNLDRWHGTRVNPSQPFVGSGGPLVPYLGLEGKIRVCPTWRPELPEDDPGAFERNCGGYGYNLAFVGRRLARLSSRFHRVDTDLLGVQTSHVSRPAATLMFADSAFAADKLIEYSFAEPRFFPTTDTRADPSVHFRHNGGANVAWCDGHVDRHVLALTWSSGLYLARPADFDVGWFGQDDDNGYFDLD